MGMKREGDHRPEECYAGVGDSRGIVSERQSIGCSDTSRFVRMDPGGNLGGELSC